MQISQLSEAEIEERFHVTGKQPVAFLLGGFVRDEVRFSVHFGEEMFLTTLLAVHGERNLLIFDCGGSDEVNRRFQRSERCVFVGRPGGVHVQFAAGHPQEMIYAGAKAFAVVLPDYVVRLQRRDFFRIEAPRAHPLEFFARLPDQRLLKLPAHDVSIAGAGLLAVEPVSDLVPGLTLENCHFALPGDDHELFLSATVRHVTEEEVRNGHHQWRIGLRLNGLSSAEEMRIQRYIARVERERHELL